MVEKQFSSVPVTCPGCMATYMAWNRFKEERKNRIINVNWPTTRVYFTLSKTAKASLPLLGRVCCSWSDQPQEAQHLPLFPLWKICESNQAEGGENAVAAQQAQSSCLCTDDIILALAVLYYWLPAPVLVVEFCTGGLEKCLRQLTSSSDRNQICKCVCPHITYI